jgi:pseudaminic acid synthase
MVPGWPCRRCIDYPTRLTKVEDTQMKTFSIHTPKGTRTIGPGYPTFVVAEMSGNHNQSFKRAVEIVEAAANAGADAIKLQTYTPDTMTIASRKAPFMERSSSNPDDWKGQSLYELYAKAYTPWDWHPRLQKEAEQRGLCLFSAPFDATAVDFLESIDVPCYKIAAYEAVDLALLKVVAQTRKPVILSVGFASEEEVRLSVETLRGAGAHDIALLHCVTSYSRSPNPEESNLSTMLDLRDRFDVVCGFSDNNANFDIPVVAACMGASIIEKHITVDRGVASADSQFSLDESEFKTFVAKVRFAEKAMGRTTYGPQNEVERQNMMFRRSLFVVRDVKKGEILTSENVRCIRPGHGLPPREYDGVLRMRASEDIEAGTPLSWKLMES